MRQIQSALLFCITLTAAACSDAAPSYEKFLTGPDTREACRDRDPLRRPFYGDLHVHTKYSFDAASFNVRAEPRDAYRFAKGEPIDLPPFGPDGRATRQARLSRPLDFVAVTDHSEFLAETTICNDPTLPGYDSESCGTYRANMATGEGNGTFGGILGLPFPQRPDVCVDRPEGCTGQIRSVFEDVANAAEEHYDRSSNCSFTTFVGYEWSGAVNGNNWHRNVIFGTRTVPRDPLSYMEYPRPEQLHLGLEANCLHAGVGCRVLTIPHNGNISSGLMFRPSDFDDVVPYDAETARRRRELEPLVEIYQHKGQSECTPGPVAELGSTDEACRFELLVPSPCTGSPSDPPGCIKTCPEVVYGGFLGVCVAPSDFARGALRTGLSEWDRVGQNPFAFGFIGSTDTHSATPGAVEEDNWQGHVGTGDDEPAESLQRPNGPLVVSRYSSPGGLAVVWAEENSRPSLFSAMQRRETYATSGTRITLRFFGGPRIAAGICDAPDLVSRAYDTGVPMGGEIRGTTSAPPRFVVNVSRDPESAPLRAVELVKGWFDGTTTHEVVHVLYEAPDGGIAPGVDLATCTPSGGGADSVCTEWVDPDFDPGAAAFYYVRVRENPTCRWSRHLCNHLAVDCSSIPSTDPLYTCCDPTFPNTIEERAWSSPIWYVPSR